MKPVLEVYHLRPAVPAFHRTPIEIRGRKILNRNQRKRCERGDLDHFRITPAASAEIQPPALALQVRCGGNEVVTGISAVQTSVGARLPGGCAKRATRGSRTMHNLDQRRPRPAKRAIPAIPTLKSTRRRVGRRRQFSLQRVCERSGAELADQPHQIRG